MSIETGFRTGSNEFLRWKFVDPYDPTSGSTYTFPRNPNTMTTPHPRRNITSTGTTAINGRKILIEGQSAPTEWTFGGNIHNSTHYEALRSWVYERTGRRVYLYDHFGRRLTIVPLQFNPTPKRTVGQYWRHTYEVSALVLEMTGPTFQVEGPLPVRNLRAVGGPLTATLTWDAPENTGGSQLVKYEVTNITNNETRDVAAGAGLSYLFRHLSVGPKQFSLTTVTAGGRSTPVVASATVLPVVGPSKVRYQNIVVGRDYITVRFLSPDFDGGSPISAYSVGGGAMVGGAILPVDARTYTFKNLLPDHSYDWVISARNVAGFGGDNDIRVSQTLK